MFFIAVSSHYGEQLLLTTELLRFYMDYDVEISNVSKIVELDLTTDLSEWVDAVATLRYEGMTDPHKAILSKVQKAVVCSSYGRQVKL